MESSDPVTFRILAARDGITLPDPLPQDWPLEKWFAAMFDVPIEDFSVFNLARSCRQNMYVDEVMPYCLTALDTNPLAGELYNGELLVAVITLCTDYWKTHFDQRDAVVTVCYRAFMQNDEDDQDWKLAEQIESWVALHEILIR